jgi:hypothetical protein
MSDNTPIFDEVDYHEHTCAACDESYHCCCPDPDEETHEALCPECFKETGEE